MTRIAGAQRELRIALAGGGTGGHIVPGLHLLAGVEEDCARPVDVVWFTSGRAVEDRVLGAAREQLAATPFERVVLPIEPKGGGAPSRAGLVLRTPSAVLRARERLIAHRSDVVVGLGGFTSLPVVLAARSLKIPVVLLEVNAHRGEATRWLARFAARILHASRATLPDGEDRVNRFVGPPLAPFFAAHAALDESARERAAQTARRELGLDPKRPLLVVLGGSQGSSALNAFVREHLVSFLASGLQVVHQTGPNKIREAGPECSGYRAQEYVEDVPRALTAATIALVRGGASTLAEVAALRVPALVAPYPGHADKHQEKNAAQLGAGVLIVQDSELNAHARDEILALSRATGSNRLRSMRTALAAAVPTDSTRRIWREILAAKLERENTK
ncbi:MAG: UDP-N-acetylglucosamine--N-acetylmuramyl-(pentapeptide) pyrophosphoryl-undecaprenol N-acetylglucosamine transferase [Planctomycetes bacterium]|nr:UDP-N-acetylglucosamine--N-acetylmuramyl-(pentapeptide) pyrophosphoryl-undecaprenol N-acetylglucosamine transferase [Planctomycetota bacterium]